MEPSLAQAEKKPPRSSADYTISIHVQASRLADLCAHGCGWVQHLIVLIDGKKHELSDRMWGNPLVETDCNLTIRTVKWTASVRQQIDADADEDGGGPAATVYIFF